MEPGKLLLCILGIFLGFGLIFIGFVIGAVANISGQGGDPVSLVFYAIGAVVVIISFYYTVLIYRKK